MDFGLKFYGIKKEDVIKITSKDFAKIVLSDIAKHNTNNKYDFKAISDNIEKVLDAYIFKYASLEFIREHYEINPFKNLGPFYRRI